MFASLIETAGVEAQRIYARLAADEVAMLPDQSGLSF
jgi:hypothetical protein